MSALATGKHRFVAPRDPAAEPVCTLDRETAEGRDEPPDRLLGEATAQELSETGATYHFASKPDMWERVARFVDEEGDCCPFFAFDQREEGDEIVLRIFQP